MKREQGLISHLFVNKITSGNNQHITMMTVGDTGEGKSLANIRLAYNMSLLLSKKFGNPPDNYFSLDHVAIITKDEVLRVMEGIRKYGIYIMDDIGVGWDAREWNTQGNKIMNHIEETFRTENCIVLKTLPMAFLIDKVPRMLTKYYMEMLPGAFDKGEGYGIAKFFKRVLKHRLDRVFYTYESFQDVSYKRAIFTKPPEEIRLPYEAKREEVARALRAEGIEKYKELIKPKEEKKSRNGDHLEAYIQANEMVKNGLKITQACKRVGLHPNTLRSYIVKSNLPSLGEY